MRMPDCTMSLEQSLQGNKVVYREHLWSGMVQRRMPCMARRQHVTAGHTDWATQAQAGKAVA